MRSHLSKRMVVEGHEDKFAVIELMGHHIEWSDDKKLAPVHVEVSGGVDDILATGFITGKLKESGLEALGVVLDADDLLDSRWKRIKSLCEGLFTSMPDQLPASGLILEDEDKIRFGVWIMPDNQSDGMLETFLHFLIPEICTPLAEFARFSVEEARGKKGAPCKECHLDKALIHTWLSWQDPPGLALGRALTQKILDPSSTHALPFINWFKNLYDL